MTTKGQRRKINGTILQNEVGMSSRSYASSHLKCWGYPNRETLSFLCSGCILFSAVIIIHVSCAEWVRKNLELLRCEIVDGCIRDGICHEKGIMTTISKYRCMCFVSKQKSAGSNWFISVNHQKKVLSIVCLASRDKNGNI